MKIFLFILAITTINVVYAQIDSYKITQSDTIELPDLSFKRVAALHLEEATILVDFDLFMKHLTMERKGLKKQIRSRERLIKRGTSSFRIVSFQLKSYKMSFTLEDSVFSVAKRNRLDTFHVDYIKTPIGDFIPSAIENKQCMVLDSNNQKQKFVIKLTGSKKTGQMTAVGSSFYFIPGATKYFIGKMDWVS